MIVGLLQLVFYVSAVAALVAGGVGLTRVGLPGFVAWPVAWLVSALFGLAMTTLLLSFPRLARLYDDAPENGATGEVFTVTELVVPYLIVAVMAAVVMPPMNAQRQQNGLPPLTFPGWVLYAPFAIGVPMGIVRLLVRTPRVAEQPAPDSHRAQTPDRSRDTGR